VDGAHDLRLRLRKSVERAAGHVDLALLRAQLEALLVEQVDDLLDSCVVVGLTRQRVPGEEVAAPGLAGLLCANGAVVRGREGAGEHGREQPMLVGGLLGRLRLERVEDPRATAGGTGASAPRA